MVTGASAGPKTGESPTGTLYCLSWAKETDAAKKRIKDIKRLFMVLSFSV
jgi:hypothetical protein